MRNPRHDGVVEIELVDEIEIEIGEIVDGVERWRLLGAAEAWMARGDQARPLRQAIERRRRCADADAGMQEQQRPTAAALDQLDADAVDHPRGGPPRGDIAVCGH
jgi:hypothetical protein